MAILLVFRQVHTVQPVKFQANIKYGISDYQSDLSSGIHIHVQVNCSVFIPCRNVLFKSLEMWFCYLFYERRWNTIAFNDYWTFIINCECNSLSIRMLLILFMLFWHTFGWTNKKNKTGTFISLPLINGAPWSKVQNKLSSVRNWKLENCTPNTMPLLKFIQA